MTKTEHDHDGDGSKADTDMCFIADNYVREKDPIRQEPTVFSSLLSIRFALVPLYTCTQGCSVVLL